MPATQLREVLAGPQSSKHGCIPKLLLPGDDSLMTPFIQTAAAIIREGRNRPELAPHLYRRDNLLIVPIPGTRRFIHMKSEYFVSWCDRHFAPYKMRCDSNGDPYEIIRPMPKEVAKATLESIEFTMAMPPIKRTFPIPVPIIPADGGPLRLCQPGYDAPTGAFVFESDFPRNPAFCVPGDEMTTSGGYYDERQTLSEAVHHLHSLHSNMPFSDWSEPFFPTEDSPFFDPEKPATAIRRSRSLSVQIMAMLSIFAAGCVPPQASRLGFLYNANKQRSGKTLLVKMIITAIYGSFKAQSWRDSDEDMIKILDAETLAATTYVCFDNIRSLIASAPLEGFMTTPNWTGRILGRSEMFEAENNAVVFLTANNASLGPDMQERTLVCDLYVETADKQNRSSELDPSLEIDDVWLACPENRHKILSSLWTIVRHWNAAGRPLATGKPRKGFATWCRILGGMVEFAGFGDCLERPSNLENCGDSETNDIRSLVEWASRAEKVSILTFQQVIHLCWDKGLIPWCLHGKEDYHEEGIGGTTLRLTDAANARMGALLQRNCSGERGEIHSFATETGKVRHVRFFCRGKGRGRRFHFEDVTAQYNKPN